MFATSLFTRDSILLAVCVEVPINPPPPPPPPCSADQEESFRMMENLLVCIRHCSELRRTKDPSALSVSYLHLYQYHILTIALRYFQEDLQGGVARGVANGHGDHRSSTTGRRYVPTLSSTDQIPGI